ncbi:5-(carboxyamino)imidazole ribonucleotide synthase [soil metagenome]
MTVYTIMKNRIGIVGGGQLGRMLAFEAKKMGFVVSVTDPTPQSPAGQVSDHQIVADYQDEKAIRELAKRSDFLTFEVELANAKILDELSEQGLQVNPSAKTLTIIKDKLKQKDFLAKVGIPVAEFLQVTTRTDIINAGMKFGYPMLLKARFDAYDGRGNALVSSPKDIEVGLEKLKGRDLYVEKFVPFVKELAIMVARNAKGEIKTYSVVETMHKNNICHTVLAPAPVSALVKKRAKNVAIMVMKHLKGAGVFGIEMFLTKDKNVLINEIAPRVHNSGHYTIEGAFTSQFEQHIRAIAGLPLGSTELTHPAIAMVNILGERTGDVQVTGIEKALAIPGVSVHIYGKAQTKVERKMGHITAVGKTIDEAHKKAKRARKMISI